MSTSIKLGAINKLTGKYVYPDEGNKECEYICIDCGKNVILRRDKISCSYFGHTSEDNLCSYFSKPNESQIHKSAKFTLKNILESDAKLSVTQTCMGCKISLKHDIQERTPKSQINIEHSFQYNGAKKADVAYVEDEDICYIFEILHTSKTLGDDGPEPWFELDANEVIERFYVSNRKNINLRCVREKKCDKCQNKNVEQVKQTNATKLGKDQMDVFWKIWKKKSVVMENNIGCITSITTQTNILR